MGYDARAVVEDGRVVLEGLPYADGCAVDIQVTPANAPSPDLRPPSELSAEEWIERMHRVAREIHARHPDAPVLTDYEMSRESIYEDRGL